MQILQRERLSNVIGQRELHEYLFQATGKLKD